LFSDKTGTLTKNIMIFKKCSINGKMYLQQGRGLQETNRSYSLKIGECSVSAKSAFDSKKNSNKSHNLRSQSIDWVDGSQPTQMLTQTIDMLFMLAFFIQFHF
jgi:magnesium-transporting ATPase (P-type)